MVQKKTKDERDGRMLLNSVPGVGPITLSRLLENFHNDPWEILDANESELKRVRGVGEQASAAICKAQSSGWLDKEKEKLKKIIEENVPKEKYTVQLESMDSNAAPFVITFPEFMRRMKEMQQSGGNSMFGNMPEIYNLIINVNNPINSEILKSKSKDKKERVIKQSLDLSKLSNSYISNSLLTLR